MPSRLTAPAILLFIGALAGCSPTSPTRVPVPNGGGFPEPVRLVGTVLDEAFQPISDAKVEVLTGQAAGTSTTTNALGIYELSGAYTRAETLRASKEGYEAASHAYNLGSNFFLKSLIPAVDLRGTYTLTIEADPSCTTLQEHLRSRRYTAVIEGYGKVSGADFLKEWDFFGTFKSANNVALSTDWDGIPALVERVSADGYLAFLGTAYVQVSTPFTTISAPFSGYIEHCVTAAMDSFYSCSPAQRVARCDSSNHRFTLVRR